MYCIAGSLLGVISGIGVAIYAAARIVPAEHNPALSNQLRIDR